MREPGVDAEVDKWRQCDRTHDSDAVLGVAYQTCIAARSHNALDGNRDRVGTQTRIAGIFGHHCPIWVGQIDYGFIGEEGQRRHRADIKTANVVFSAHVEAVEGWRHESAVTTQE